MGYVVVFIATRWGSELGGINVFNTGLAKGMAKILPKDSCCICYVAEMPAGPSLMDGVELRKYSGDADLIADDILSQHFSSELLPRGVLVVGHDVKTGQIAIDCVNTLKKKVRESEIISAVVSHMDYAEYGRNKGQTLSQVTSRSRAQHETVAAADFAFAVGPLLESNFQIARKRGDKGKGRVHRLIPGAAEIQCQPEDERQGLRFFISGRLNREDDTIKNGFLAIDALLEAYQTQRELGQGRWSNRGCLYACGVDPIEDEELLTPLMMRARSSTAFEIEAQPFSTDQGQMYQWLASSHIALMPSWHEGFGLTGWEALCAGVPLVCSRQSGLALLIEDLRQQLPSVPFESVEFVSLAGSIKPGISNEQDRTTIAQALIRIVNDYPRRKKAAAMLAKSLQAEYTWDRCAYVLIEQIGWDFPSSVNWRTRQKVASRDTTGAEESGTIALALEACADGHIERDWSVLCSAFNAFSNLGKNAGIAERKYLLQQLETIGQALSQALEGQLQIDSGETHLTIRDTGYLDLCWRYMAASSSIAPSFREFTRLIAPEMLNAICSDSFLCRELLYYVCRFAKEFPHRSKSLATKFLKPFTLLLENDNLVQVRLARIAIVYPEILLVIKPGIHLKEYEAETARCQKLLALPHDVTSLLHEAPALAPSLLALSGLKPDAVRQSVDQAFNFFRDYHGSEIKLTWRGDKRLYAGLLTSGIPSHQILQLLNSMAGDEEEAVRWAAIDLAFSSTLRSRLESAALSRAKSEWDNLLSSLGAIVDKAVAFDSGHPWLQREFLQLYAREHERTSKKPTLRKFSIYDFPHSRRLFGPLIGMPTNNLNGSMHPEVRGALIDAQRSIKRVLLVLPPIQVSSTGRHEASTTSTPPLGLGLIATHLSRTGHDVQLVDCHRYPQFYRNVSTHAHTFDLIGLNVVLSTVRSAHQLLKEIRRQTSRPVLVVGGPAANLNAWQFSAEDDEEWGSWDFAISNDAFENLTRLVTALDTQGPWPSSRYLIANENSSIVALRDVQSTSERVEVIHAVNHRSPLWETLNVDRRVYCGPTGRYEPAKTRSGSDTLYEAHVVMSQGCDWNCSFCTERKSLSGGERRRSVDSVLSELNGLARTYPNLRIQFIDDNLLPQVAAIDNLDKVSQAKAMEWADAFLKGLHSISQSHNELFVWRGIFRLEDFFHYEACWPGNSFVSMLVRSGCRMLAFGVEHGDEKRRRRLKAGTSYRNEDIVALFSRLKTAGIHTKAYFMLGGRSETRQTAEKTIAFALESGVTLAYFALYKEFVKATRELSKESLPEDEEAARYLSYSQLWPRWDEELLSETVGNQEKSNLQSTLSDEEVATYMQLADLGFRFDDLVKYNDYHSDTGPSASVLSLVTWNSSTEYFKAVEQAYFRFYLRPKFVDDYKTLIANGY
ncbi:B12-binding domain-containing radical SAM protein [Pseudomonas gingeri]|uniref:Radical SAM protein n=1 Tax=Pseudomonas gingeri TaxID=117681 RepID=A0A7Y7YBU2_9PSED|nr:radical SAM protein [Pseudomonas gingeri]NWB31019.1 radical SAM protein [Pseudomonas gingeri]NWC33581.1 radical SAM protein [Pseudomonas gingeri]